MEKNVPKIRFEEFKYSYRVESLEDIITISKEKYQPVKDEDLLDVELEHIKQGEGEINGYTQSSTQKSTKNKFIKGQVLFGKLRPYLKKYWHAEFDGVCSSEIWVIDGKKIINEYAFQMIQTDKFINLANTTSGTKMPRADWSLMKAVDFHYPQREEQCKVSSFLSTIDSRIANQSAKLDSLQELKKGVMQKIFSQEIRFKREDGGEYPDWTFKKINEIFDFYSTNSLSRDKLTSKESLMKNIHYGDIHTKFKSTLDVASVELPSIKDLYSNTLRNFQLAIDGDVFIADASEDYADIGKATEILNINGDKIVGGLHVLHLRDIKHKYVNGFRGYLFNSADVRKQIKLLAVGSKVLGISKPNMGKIEIPVLQREEQEKITDLLSTLDSKINIETRILSTLQTLKKGLLQQMFV